MSAVTAWIEAARDARIGAEIEAIYERIGADVAREGPACWASGRCCNFERAGHLLFVTGLEAAFTVERAGWPAPPPAPPSPARAVGVLVALEVLVPDPAVASSGAGACPFQTANRCDAHAARPLGCRVYFCDREAQQWQRELSERGLGEIRDLHAQSSIPYEYAEWRGLLARIRAEQK